MAAERRLTGFPLQADLAARQLIVELLTCCCYCASHALIWLALTFLVLIYWKTLSDLK